MEKEISFNDLTNDEKICFDILQSIVKNVYLSYGYHDDTICVSKVADGWIAYFVDRGQIFNLKKYHNVFDVSKGILYEISENNEVYNEIVNEFYTKLRKDNIHIPIIEQSSPYNKVIPMIPPKYENAPLTNEETEQYALVLLNKSKENGINMTIDQAKEIVHDIFDLNNSDMKSSKKR